MNSRTKRVQTELRSLNAQLLGDLARCARAFRGVDAVPGELRPSSGELLRRLGLVEVDITPRTAPAPLPPRGARFEPKPKAARDTGPHYRPTAAGLVVAGEPMFCIVCLCTERAPCAGPCRWLHPYLCSSCG